ncbi:regulatory protein ToxS [Vibrio sp. E150_011]|uniref:regulatory protein ToxS n=1 Tax=Vibrio sp. 10N.261.51.F12 TaxID=3229679 RepID=UPI0035540437
MKMKYASILLALSTALSAWLYWGSDLKLEQVLTSNEWQSNMVGIIAANNAPDTDIGPLSRLEMSANVKYLPEGTYIRESSMRLFGKDSESHTLIKISETGSWAISDNYLLISPREFKDTATAQSDEFTHEQLAMIKQFLKMEAQQSRRIDIVNGKTLLLTSLNQGSSVLFSN